MLAVAAVGPAPREVLAAMEAALDGAAAAADEDRAGATARA